MAVHDKSNNSTTVEIFQMFLVYNTVASLLTITVAHIHTRLRLSAAYTLFLINQNEITNNSLITTRFPSNKLTSVTTQNDYTSH